MLVAEVLARADSATSAQEIVALLNMVIIYSIEYQLYDSIFHCQMREYGDRRDYPLH